MNRRWIWPAAILLLATVLRLPGLFTDFWFDEIWSWAISGKLHRVVDILVSPAAQIDNNHPLNTLWLYLLGSNSFVWLYRLPALLAGIATVAVSMHCMHRRGRIAGLAAGVLTAISFPLVFYSSEARGYSLAVCFGVIAFDAMDIVIADAAQPEKGWQCRWIFAVAASLGFLSHLTFLHVYAAAFVWSVVRMRGRWRQLLELHALPVFTALILSQVFVKHMVIGGALPRNPLAVLTETLSLLLGGPGRSVVVAIFAAVLFAIALAFNRGRTRPWLFYLVVVFASPALTTVQELMFSEHPQPLMLRYFLVCVPFYFFALCPLIEFISQSRSVGRIAISVATVIVLVGNGMHYVRSLRDGRGHPAATLAHIAAVTPTGTINLASASMWRTQLVLSFYAPRMQPPRVIALRETEGDWVIVNRAQPNGTEVPASIDFHGADYSLDLAYPENELDGWSWLVYRKR